MFVKLAVLACVAVSALGQHWNNGAGQPQPRWNGPLAGGTPAHLYPAGVSPQACPNFPNCANPAVAASPQAQAGWNANTAAQAQAHAGWAQQNQGGWNGGQQQGGWNGGQQQGGWNQGGWNGGNQNALDSGVYTGDGDWHGEGLQESGAGNQGGWNGGQQGGWNGGQQGGWNGGQQGGWNGGAQQVTGNVGVPAQIPAGVDASSCPNYPYCH